MRSDGSAPAGASFEVRERVRSGDVDASGTIGFGAYARLIDVAETEYFRRIGFAHARLRELGVRLPRVHLEFDFYRPALLDDELALRTGVRGVGVHSVRLRVEIVRANEEAPLAEATLVVACVNAAQTSAPLPDALVAALRAQLDPA